jgi:hypothetical protein
MVGLRKKKLLLLFFFLCTFVFIIYIFCNKSPAKIYVLIFILEKRKKKNMTFEIKKMKRGIKTGKRMFCTNEK